MSLQLLTETIIFGNLDTHYTNQIKKDLTDKLPGVIHSLENRFPVNDESVPWRFMGNLSFIVDSCEAWILSDKDNFCKIMDFVGDFIDICLSKMKISDLKTPDFLEKPKDFMIVNFKILLNRVYSKLSLYKISDVNVKVDPFIRRFSKFLDDDGIYYDNVTPYDEIKWTSKWKLILQNKEMIVENVDVFLDSYFKNSNFYYNKTMFANIKKLSARLLYLRTNAPNYYNILTQNIRDVSKNIYDVFPIKVVYKDYRNLLPVDSRVHRRVSFDFKNENMWMLSVIPKFLSSYILGFPVVSFDIPSETVIERHIEMLSRLGEEKYFDFITKSYNIPNIKSREFGIKTGNPQDEGGEVLDLCYCPISEYNQDDVVSLYNNGVVHHFSCREFESILRKQENPYNRQKYPNFTKILENMKFKKKMTKNLLLRGLNLDLNGTMLENFQDLKEKMIKDQDDRDYPMVFNETDMIYRPFIDIFLNNLY